MVPDNPSTYFIVNDIIGGESRRGADCIGSKSAAVTVTQPYSTLGDFSKISWALVRTVTHVKVRNTGPATIVWPQMEVLATTAAFSSGRISSLI